MNSHKNNVLNHVLERGVKLANWGENDREKIIVIPPSKKLYQNFTGLYFDEETPCFTVSGMEWLEFSKSEENNDFDFDFDLLANPIFERFFLEITRKNDSVFYVFERFPIGDDGQRVGITVSYFFYYYFGKDQKQNQIACDTVFSIYTYDLEIREVEHSYFSTETLLKTAELKKLDSEGLESLSGYEDREFSKLREICYLQKLLTKKKATSYLVKPKKLPPSAKPKNSKGKPMKHHSESEYILVYPNADKKVYIPANAEELEVKKTGTPKRPHNRRGTMRHLKSGKIVPVKPSKIKGGGAGGRVYSLVCKTNSSAL